MINMPPPHTTSPAGGGGGKKMMCECLCLREGERKRRRGGAEWSSEQILTFSVNAKGWSRLVRWSLCTLEALQRPHTPKEKKRENS